MYTCICFRSARSAAWPSFSQADGLKIIGVDSLLSSLCVFMYLCVYTEKGSELLILRARAISICDNSIINYIYCCSNERANKYILILKRKKKKKTRTGKNLEFSTLEQPWPVAAADYPYKF